MQRMKYQRTSNLRQDEDFDNGGANMAPLRLPDQKGPRHGHVRTWREIAKIIGEREGNPGMCAQTIINTHDVAIKKLQKLLWEEFGPKGAPMPS